MPIGLSKSKYCKGVQCPKILWMDKHMPEEAVDTGSEAVLTNGTKVGELARGYFGAYSEVEYSDDKKAMCLRTQELIASGTDVIAEASFAVDGLYCAVDLLRRNGDGWDIIEVKSSTSVQAIYVDDMAFQNYVLNRCGVKVERIFNMHIDNTYVFHEKLDIHGLFVLEDYTDICKSKYGEVEENVKAFRAYAEQLEEPEQKIGVYCWEPYDCAYYQHCWKDVPEQSVFNVRKLNKYKKFELYHKGIVTFADIIRERPRLNKNQWQQVETAYYHKPDSIDREAIGRFLKTLSYPIYHLDFETFQLAVPEWEGCRPYEQIPFQYSLHIEYEDGRLEHREFLAKEGTDPRRALAERLCADIPLDVCGMAYNMGFEKGVIRNLAEVFPDLSEHLMSIHDNMHDLMALFLKKSWYSEAMQGSYSIKYVLPALCPDDPELNYHNLDQIHNGTEAMNVFATMAELPPEEVEKLRENLLKYCGLDTYAMVKVLEKLREITKYNMDSH